MKNELPSGITQENIDQWKKQYGSKNIFSVKVPLDDDNKKFASCIVRKPDLKVIAAAVKFELTDPIKSGIVMFENCYLGGDEIIKQEDELKSSVIQELNHLYIVRKSELKNL